jgi:hypothetical protein
MPSHVMHALACVACLCVPTLLIAGKDHACLYLVLTTPAVPYTEVM